MARQRHDPLIMNDNRARANVPRGGQRQTLSGLDSYHQFMVQSSRDFQRPRAASSDRLQRPYVTTGQSFSAPRRSHTPSSSMGSANVPPPDTFGTNGPRPYTRGNLINPRASAIRYASPIPPPATPESTEMADVTKSDRLLNVSLPWRPLYLRRRVLLCFFLLFASLAAAVEILFEFSNRNSGVAWPSQGERYAWQFLAPAVLLLVAVTWSRVEYQAKATAPWHRMAKGPADLDSTLMLDYNSMIWPLVMRASVRNRDWLVAMTSLTGALLKLLMVASVALVVPTLADVRDNMAAIRVTDSFAGDGSQMRDAGVLAVNSMVALQARDSDLPEGLTREAAFQSFESDLPATAALRATVEGFQSGLECEAAELTLTSVQLIRGTTTQLNLRVSAGSCVTTHNVENQLLASTENGNVPRVFMRFRDSNCNNSPAAEDQRIVVMTGAVTLGPGSGTAPNTQNAEIAGTILQSAAIICRPSYTITPFDVTKNGTQIIRAGEVVNSRSRTLAGVPAWALAEAHFDAWAQVPGVVGIPTIGGLYSGQAVVDSDDIIDAVVSTEVIEAGRPQLGALLQPGTLDRLSNAYWRRYTAFLAKDSLMVQSRQDIRGQATLTGERIVVKEVPTHLMAALLGIATLITLAADYLAPKDGFLPQSPSTIIGVATLLSHSRPLLQCLRGAGAADEATLRQRLSGSKYYTGVEAYEKPGMPNVGYFKILGGHPPPATAPIDFAYTGDWKRPLPLRLWSRLGLIAVTFTMVIGLELVLRFSDTRNGFAALPRGDYIYLIWTSVTALLLGTVALYASKADFETRILAPYAKLRFGGSLARTAALDFLDRARLPVIWSAIRTGNPSVLVTAITALLAGSLIIFAGSLFKAIPAYSSRNIVIQSTDFFADTIDTPAGQVGVPVVLDRDTAVSSLIFHSNLSFPPFTFEDLNIPAARLETPLPPSDTNVGEVEITTTLRALRPNLDCRLYPTSEITTNITLNYQVGGISDPLRIDLAAEPCRNPSSELLGSNAIISTARGSSSSGSGGFFGWASTRNTNPSQCSDLMYTWGHLDNSGPNGVQVSYISAMGCNETLQTVTADVTFRGQDLRIDPATPPRVQESTAMANGVALPPLQYDSLVDMDSPGNSLDPFFSTLTTSRFALPVQLLGDNNLDTAGKVADAIVAHHKIIRTQSLNIRTRRTVTPDGNFPTTESGTQVGSGLDPGVDAATAQPRLVATLMTVNTALSRRLQVDEVTVRILQVLLSVILLGGVASLTLALIGSGGVVGIGMLPRHPGSIASLAALLADGNVFGYLPRGAEWMSSRELEDDMRQKGEGGDFAMGWEAVKRRRRDDVSRLGLPAEMRKQEEEFGIRVVREGGWQGGSEVGLGWLARIGVQQRLYAR